MAAPRGNQFWKLRTKHGDDRAFATPQDLLEAAYEYFDWCERNPLKEMQVMKIKVSRDEEKIVKVKVDKMRPFTHHGLTSYLGVNTVYFNHFEKQIKDYEPSLSEDFSKVITHIRETVYNQKFTGAAANFFNANIISRELGLTDKTESHVTVDQPLFPDVSTNHRDKPNSQTD